MNERKLVHVNAYTKDDGTQVREHYRGVGERGGVSSYPNNSQSPQTIYGGIEENVLLQDLEEDANTKKSISKILDNTNKLVNVISKISNLKQRPITMMPPLLEPEPVEYQFEEIVNDLKDIQQTSEIEQKETLNKLSKIQDKTQFNELSKNYAQQKNINNQNKTTILQIENAVKNKNFESAKQLLEKAERVLKDYANIYQKAVISPYSLIPLALPIRIYNESYKKFYKKSVNKFLGSALKNHPELEKSIINATMTAMSTKEKATNKQADYNELWKASAYNFEQSSEYINKNGELINSVKQLPQDLQEFVTNKLQEQLNVSDAKGIIFKPDSNFTRELAISSEFRRFIQKNIIALAKNQLINGSTYLGTNKNTRLSLGHADIFNAHLDKKGNLHAYIIDTYDFNKNDPDWKVQWARDLQEKGLITNFYTINKIVIPKEEWLNPLYLWQI